MHRNTKCETRIKEPNDKPHTHILYAIRHCCGTEKLIIPVCTVNTFQLDSIRGESEMRASSEKKTPTTSTPNTACNIISIEIEHNMKFGWAVCDLCIIRTRKSVGVCVCVQHTKFM